jgi:iron complex transport system ATP-binding protein
MNSSFIANWSDMNTPALLSTKQLSVGYGKGLTQKRILANLNLTLFAGELVCFMGPNGIGKSTLLRTLAGLQVPLEGAVHLNKSVDIGKAIAVVLTDRVQAYHMTARELITYGRYPYLNWSLSEKKEDLEKIEHAIDQLHLRPLADQSISSLSDGQLQMVMIARAVAQDTPILLLDEPTAHLDLNNRVEIMTVLRKLARDLNKSILLATHELDLALQMADRIWLITKNGTIATGLPEDLVLNGTFDQVFELKGFDLRTGKVAHHPHQNKKIKLNGEGYVYLWTKNALERNGYEVTEDSGEHIQFIDQKWIYRGATHDSLFTLLQALDQS